MVVLKLRVQLDSRVHIASTHWPVRDVHLAQLEMDCDAVRVAQEQAQQHNTLVARNALEILIPKMESARFANLGLSSEKTMLAADLVETVRITRLGKIQLPRVVVQP